MELRELEKVNPMTVDFHGLSVTFNPDAFTDGFYYAVADRVRHRLTSEVKKALDDKPDESDIPEHARPALNLINRLADRIKLEGEKITEEKESLIALLVGTPEAPVLLGWDLTDGGVPVPCNEEGLRTFKKKETLEDLWHTIRDAPFPKSQGIATIPQSQTTSESTQSPSASPATQAEDSPVM